MLRAVLVADERNDAGNHTTLCCRRTSEDTQISIADEVARATDTIHHLHTTDMGGVGITIDITLDSSIDGDNTQSADDLRTVGDLALTQCQVLLEMVHVIVNLHQTVVGDRQRASGGILHTTVQHHLYNSIL